MTDNLKTLKDLGYIYTDIDRHKKDYSKPHVSCAELKQEAIKWVKENMRIPYHSYSNEWIKHFFNLTEEDLK